MTCRHCQERIKVCECGADSGRRHFVDIASNSRYCRTVRHRTFAAINNPIPPPLSQLHEPAPKGQTP